MMITRIVLGIAITGLILGAAPVPLVDYSKVGIHYSSFSDWEKHCVQSFWPGGATVDKQGNAIAAATKEAALNQFKNTASAPAAVKEINLSDVAAPLAAGEDDDFDRFKDGMPVQLTGWVKAESGGKLSVKIGGVETCNCKAGEGAEHASDQDSLERDTHIEVYTDLNSTKEPVIVEVTPAIRAEVARQHLDWTTAHLHALLPGHKIKVRGYLFYDAEHKPNAINSSGAGNIWRQTCWEIHPITGLELLDQNDKPDQQIGSSINGKLN